MMDRRANAALTVMLLLAALMLGGCQGFTLFLKTPRASVSSVELTEQTEEGGRVVATVAVENPNEIVLPVPRVHYTIRVADAAPFRFTTVPGVALPREGTQTLRLPAAFDRAAAEFTGQTYRVTGHVVYRPAGEVEAVLFGSGWPLPRASFAAEGTIGESATAQQAQR